MGKGKMDTYLMDHFLDIIDRMGKNAIRSKNTFMAR
jgi:hypothetical protein